LELFYDLIYAVAVTQVSSILEADLSFRGFLIFLAFLLPVWWVWLGFAVYTTRFDVDDVPHRMLAFVQMLAIATMAVQLHAHEFGSRVVAAAFVAARLSLLMMYGRASGLQHAAPVIRVYFVGFGFGAFLWALSMIIPLPWRYGFWGAGLITEFISPWIGRSILQRLPLHPARLPERLGTFASIVLYVAIEAIVVGVGQVHAAPKPIAIAFMSFVWAICIWWIYTSISENKDLRRVLGSGQPYIYCHFPIVVGLSILSIGIREAIVGADNAHYPATICWLLGGGLACWCAAIALIRFAVVRDTRLICAAANIIAVGSAVAFAVIGTAFEPLAATMLLTLVLIGMLIAELLPRTGTLDAAPF